MFLAGEVYTVVGAKVVPQGFVEGDKANAKLAASAEAAERRQKAAMTKMAAASQTMGRSTAQMATATETAMSRASNSTIRASGVYQDELGRWRETNGRFVSSARQVELGLNGVTAASGRSTRANHDHAASLAKSNASLRSMGTAAKVTAVGGLAGLVIGLFDSANKAGDLQQTLSVLQATTKATDKQMAGARKTAVALGNDIDLPATSAKDAADAMNELAKGGLTVTQSMAAAKGVLQLSAAAQISNAEAATIVADNLNAFNLKAQESVRISDLLAASANATTASIPEMGLALQQSAASAHQLGIPIEDLVTMLGELANAGIKGSDAGTSVKTMLGALTPNSAKAATAIKKLGVETFDAQGHFRGTRAVIEDYRQGLSKLTDEQKAQTIETIFGSDASRAASIILDGGVKSYDKLRHAVTQTGAAQNLAKAQTEGYNGAAEAMKSAVDTAKIAIGDVFLPILTEGAREAARFVSELEQSGKLKQWSQDLLSGGKTAAQVLGDVADAAADAGHVGVQAAQGIAAVADALDIAPATGIEAALAAFLGFKAVGVVGPQMVRLAAGIRAVQAAYGAGGLVGVAGLANPITAAAIAVGALGAAFVILRSKESNDTKLAEENAAAHKAQAEAIKSVMDAERAAADKGLAAKQSTLDLKQAQQDLNDARKKYGKDSPEYARALLDEQQAALRADSAHKEYTNSLDKQDQANKKSVQTAKERVEATNREVEAARRQLQESSKPIQTVGGKTVQRAPRAGDVHADAVATQRQADAVQAYIQAVARANVSDLSRNRLMSASTQIAERNVQGISQLVSAIGDMPTKTQTKILLSGGQDALAQLGNLAGQLTAVGRKKTVAKVLANANSATAAVLAFKAILAGVPLSKVTKVLANTKGKQEVQALKDLIAQVQPKSVEVSVTTRYRQIGVQAPNAAGGGGPARRAKGRGSGNRELSLVGENPSNPREAIVDPVRGTAFMVDRPTIMPLSDTAYVIPEDPQYRGRAMGILADLAGQLGLQGFKKGRKSKSKAKIKRDLPGDVQPTKLPLEEIEDKRNKAKNALDKAKATADRLPKNISTTQAQIRDIKRRKPKTAAQKANKADDLARAEKKLATQREDLRKARAEEVKQRKTFKAYEKERVQAVRFQQQITKQEQLADTAASEMRTADAHDDQGGYDTAKAKRLKALKDLRSLLDRARKALADQDSEAARDLDKTIAATDSDVADTEDQLSQSGQDAETDADRAAQAEADKYAETGMTAEERARRSQIEKDIALAALTQPLDDDKAAAGSLVEFLQGVLAAAPGRGLSDDVIADIAGQVKQARDNYTSLTTGGGSNSDSDLQAQIDQANERTRAADESARINAQALATFAGYGDIGSGGPSALSAARGVTVNQTVNTLHPGDPATLRAIGDAATGGIALQPARPSNTERIGW